MEAVRLAPFADPVAHEAISRIIRAHSSNRLDVREAILRGLDLRAAREVLDLGCGFGFLAEAVAERVAPDARVTGVDACAANRSAFLARVGRTGRRARFLRRVLGSRLAWPDRSFDLVLASYSLYYFAGVLPHVARILRPRGVFLALTHSERSLGGLLHALGMTAEPAPLHATLGAFSAENGAARLAPYFEEVTRVDYRNLLRFHPEDMEAFLAYVRFKLPFVVSEAARRAGALERGVRAARASLRRAGRVIVEKNDAAFVARRPRGL